MTHNSTQGGWGFHNPVAIRFGEGCIAPALQTLPYRRVLLVTTGGMTRRGTSQWLAGIWPAANLQICDQVLPNPELAALDHLAWELRSQPRFDAIVALGGGSAVDTGKILSILLGAPETFTLKKHFTEGLAFPTKAIPLPVIAIPTTSGTGSEVTPFATVWDTAAVKKYSLAGPHMFPRFALLDPTLTHNLPWEITLTSGLDALCQALESVWNRNANPITLEFAYRAAGLAWHTLQEGHSILASPILRARLMEASLLAGLAISHTRTALCHSMSYPLTARFGIPHGLACGFTIPDVLRFNGPTDDGRLQHLAEALGHDQVTSFASAIANLLFQLNVPHLVRSNIPDIDALPKLASEMITPGRSDNNLRPASVSDVTTLMAGITTRLRSLTK